MNKLTLSIHDKEKLNWVKEFAKENNTSISRLFEEYVAALKAFDQKKVRLSDRLQALKQPGKRPSQAQIKRHLDGRRRRSPGQK